MEDSAGGHWQFHNAQQPVHCLVCTKYVVTLICPDSVPDCLLWLPPAAAQLALFAGRRSTDRAFLLLQNVLCARCLPNYGGTSSILAVTLIDRALRANGVTDPRERMTATGGRLPCSFHMAPRKARFKHARLHELSAGFCRHVHASWGLCSP